MEDTDKKQSLTSFVTDILEIPCARMSYLYGIGGGLSAGLVSFLFTSRPRISSHVAMGSFSCITMGYWTHCRYNYEVLKRRVESSQRAIKEAERLQEEEQTTQQTLSEDEKGFVSV